MNTVLAQAPVYAEQDVLRGLQQYEKQAELQISQLLYYPYYFFEYELSIRSFLKLKGRTACTIDGISGHGALIDRQPEFSYRGIEPEQIPIEIGEEEARKAAEKFIFENASSKAKFVTTPKIKMVRSTLFYRPFWLADYGREEHGQHQLIVDAISGSYHPL